MIESLAVTMEFVFYQDHTQIQIIREKKKCYDILNLNPLTKSGMHTSKLSINGTK